MYKRKYLRLGIIAAVLCFTVYCVFGIRHQSSKVKENSSSRESQEIQHNFAVSEKLRYTDAQRLVMERFNKRSNHLKATCSRLGTGRKLSGSSIYKKNIYLSKSLFYSDKWKVLMCLIPKCATRSQATFLGTSEGFGAEAIHHAYEIAEKYLSPRNEKSIESVAKRIEEYTKVVVVREPFSRILSAFRDKIENGGRGRHHIKLYNEIKRRTRSDNVTFSNFLDYLVHSNGDPQTDPHWNYYERLCSPCHIDYHYVVHLDTFKEDLDFIIRTIGINNYTLPPAFNSFTDNETVHKYYRNVSYALKNDLFLRYKTDYELFEFNRPETL